MTSLMTGLHLVSDFYAMLQNSFTRVTVASGGDDAAEGSSNSALSEEFSDASRL